MNNIKIITINIQSFKVYFFLTKKKLQRRKQINISWFVVIYKQLNYALSAILSFKNCSTTAELKDSIYACMLSYTLKKNSRFDHKEKKKKISWTINYFHERYALIYTIIYLSATIKITLHRNYSKIRCKKVVKFSKQ